MAAHSQLDLQIAVIVPCRNEAASIANVVRDFQAALPGSTVFVYDNNSEDDTAKVAREAGALRKAYVGERYPAAFDCWRVGARVWQWGSGELSPLLFAFALFSLEDRLWRVRIIGHGKSRSFGIINV